MKGFSLVEMLAVCLIFGVLAAVAVPMYLNTRRTAAARSCKANISAMMAAESTMALRYGKYGNVANLVASPEGMASTPVCPLDGTSNYTIKDSGGTAVGAYTTSTATGGTTSAITIACPNATGHSSDMYGNTTSTSYWSQTMPTITTDGSLP